MKFEVTVQDADLNHSITSIYQARSFGSAERQAKRWLRRNGYQDYKVMQIVKL